MCIIVVKPADSPLPPKETLSICFENNNDGAGYMYRRGEVIHIVKGFFDFEALWKSLQAVQDEDVCIHFRWATHGEVIRGNCHPFPVSKSVKEMQNTRSHCMMGIAHNGVIHGLRASKKISDTMVFIKNLDMSRKVSAQLSVAKGNKFCVMTDTRTMLIGDFIYDKDMGCYFSNDGYKEIEAYIYYTKNEAKLYRNCLSCTKHTCEGCDELDFYENTVVDNYDLLSDKDFFDNDEDTIDFDEVIVPAEES